MNWDRSRLDIYRLLCLVVRWCGLVWWMKRGEGPYSSWDTPPWCVTIRTDDECGCTRATFRAYCVERSDRYGEYYAVSEEFSYGLAFVFKLYGPEPKMDVSGELARLTRPTCLHKDKSKYHDRYEGRVKAQVPT